MTTIKLSDTAVTDPVLVLGLAHREDKARSLVIESGDLGVDTKPLLAALKDMGATGKSDEVIKLPGTSVRLLVFTGLGKSSTHYDNETLRRAAGAASQKLDGNPAVTFALPSRDLTAVNAIAEGAALGAYSFVQFLGSSKGDHKAPTSKFTVHTSLAKKKGASAVARRAVVVARYSHLVRDLVNMPPSYLHPIEFVELMKKAVASAGGVKAGLRVTVLDEKQLKAKGYGGIIGVGQGSANPPRLLHISYTPPKAKSSYAFVGKGITFDSGGLNLKPGLGMEAMKSDMGGAAAVCAATIAIATLRLPVGIQAWAPLAENMVSDTATRPGDIITIFGGKTVEVLNPDAEGRLVLADALVKAIEVGHQGKTLDGIIDVATLTGAQSVALGTRTSAVMTNNEEMRERFLDSARQAGESFWPMPLPEELRPSLDSPVADLANIGERMGGMLVAGLFLREFVPAQMPWLHLDIASPAYNDGDPHGYTSVGGTGISLRSLIHFVESAYSRA